MNQKGDENCRRRNWKYNASAAYGTKSTQDKCSCIVQVIAPAIIRLPTAAGIKPIVVNGYSSSTATKKTMPAGKQYDGLKVVVDTFKVHGRVSSHDHTSHFGNFGKRRQQYHAKNDSDANERSDTRMNGASGIGATKKGSPTSKPCNAPGI